MKRNHKKNGRSGTSVSATVKRLKSVLQIEHLDSSSKVHLRDAAMTRKWMSDLVGRHNVSKLSDEQLDEVLESCNISTKNSIDTTFPIHGVLNQFDPRENLCFEDGKWVAKKGAEWTRFIANINDDIQSYTEYGGSVKVRNPKNGSKGKFIEPLEVMYVRATPWIASVLKSSDTAMIKKVVMEFVKRFERQTGYPVKAVNIHKESEHDLHIHIVYANVVPHFKPLSKAKLKAQEKALKADLKDELKAAGKPTTFKAVSDEYKARGLDSEINTLSEDVQFRKIIKTPNKRKLLMDLIVHEFKAKDIEFTDIDIEAEFESRAYPNLIRDSNFEFEQNYRDVVFKFDDAVMTSSRKKTLIASSKKRESWPSARRSMNVLGPAYRNKGHIYRIASSDSDKEKIRKFRENTSDSVDGSFTDRLASKIDEADDLYVDWFAENLFENMFMAQFSDKQKLAVNENMKSCVNNYISTGNSMAHPMEVALQSEKDEVAELKNTLDKRQQELIKLEAKALSKVSIATESEEKIRELEIILKSNESLLKDKEAKLIAREKTISSREITQFDNESDYSVRSKQLISNETAVESLKKSLHSQNESLAKKKEELIESGRREILTAVSAKISPSQKDEKVSEKSVDEVLNVIGKLKVRAAAYIKLKKRAVNLLDILSKQKNLPRILIRGISKVKDLIDEADHDVDI